MAEEDDLIRPSITVIVEEFRDVISQKGGQLGCIEGVGHKIDLKEEAKGPLKQPVYGAGAHGQKIVEKEIEALEEQGFIR